MSDQLYRVFPNAAEGDLTAMRAQLVRIETLGRLASNLGLGDLLYLSKGAVEGDLRVTLRILGQTFEAVVGAIYLDQGFTAAASFVKEQVASDIENLGRQATHRDAKSRLQEAAQAATGITPAYVVDSSEGPGHRPRFVVAVYLGERLLASGSGESKRDAEQRAAAVALHLWPTLMKH